MQSKQESSHGVPYGVLAVRGFIKSWTPGKLTGCEDNFPSWFDQLVEGFSYKEVLKVQTVLPACKNHAVTLLLKKLTNPWVDYENG